MISLHRKAISSLRRFAAENQKGSSTEKRLEDVLDIISRLLAHCGEQSHGKDAQIAIGRALLQPRPLIVAPCCPDYPNNGEFYTFQGELGEGVSLQAKQNIRLLSVLSSICAERIPLTIMLVYADIEAYDSMWLKWARIKQDEFFARVDRSVDATRDEVPLEWSVTTMTEFIPDFLEREANAIEQLKQRCAADTSLRTRLSNEAIGRRKLYDKVEQRVFGEFLLERARQTAAQYLVLGAEVASRGGIVTQHTTGCVAWYREAKCPLLQNRAEVY